MLTTGQQLLVELLYELLDAHDDTARLAADFTDDLRWNAHLNYLRDLQHVGRGALAQTTRSDTGKPTGQRTRGPIESDSEDQQQGLLG